MKKFTVEISRQFVQLESASITIEAASKAEARRKAKEIWHAIDEKEWAPADSSYDHYSIDEVDEA